jgi:hypothetical protein
MAIYTRWGNDVTIIAARRASEWNPALKAYADSTLVTIRYQDGGDREDEIAELLKADGGWQEIGQAVSAVNPAIVWK